MEKATTMTDHILIERPQDAPGVMVIRFNRVEKKNAITRAMYQAMTDALKAADADEAVRATVFLGSDGCFSAGNDLNDFMAFAMGGTMGREVIDFLHALATHGKPLVSGVDGLAIGIGTTIHLHCDLTYASARTRFRTYQRLFGLVLTGAYLAKGALADGGDGRNAERAALCRFAAENVIGETAALRDRVMTGAASLAAARVALG